MAFLDKSRSEIRLSFAKRLDFIICIDVSFLQKFNLCFIVYYAAEQVCMRKILNALSYQSFYRVTK